MTDTATPPATADKVRVDTIVIDADSHFFEPLDWFDVNYPELAAQCAPVNIVEMVAFSALGDDLVSNAPPQLRPSALDLAPSYLHGVLERAGKMDMTPTEFMKVFTDKNDEAYKMGWLWDLEGAYDSAGRTTFMDRHGIDYQFVLPSAPGHNPYVRANKTGNKELARQALYAWNTWAAEVLHDCIDRASPTAILDVSDVPSALAEMRRMRELGAVTFSVRGDPDRSLAHPDFEVIWSQAEDLSMGVMFHIGNGRPNVSMGWADDGSGSLFNYLTLCAAEAHQVPELAIGSMILGGVLERHPKLMVIASEFGVAWLPYWLERLDMGGFALKGGEEANAAHDRKFSLKPSEYVERQVVVTPLAAQSLGPTMAQVPNVVQFATDYPHPEGSEDCMDIFDPQVRHLSPELYASFYGTKLAAGLGLKPLREPVPDPFRRFPRSTPTTWPM